MRCGLIPYPIKLFDPTLTDASCRMNGGRDFSLHMSISEQAVQTEFGKGTKGQTRTG